MARSRRWLNAGQRRHKGAIEELRTGSPDKLPSGAPNQYWATLYSPVSASIEPLYGRELFAAQEHHNDIRVRIRCRYRSGVAEQMRYSYRGRYYMILAVIDPELRRRDLELLCGEGVVFRRDEG